MNSPVRDALSAAMGSSDPVAQQIGATALAYLDLRDLDLVSKMPSGCPRGSGSAAILAVTSSMGHPDADALLELAALLIGERRYRDALVHPDDYQSGFGNAFGTPEARQEVFRAVSSAARRVSVPDEEIVRYYLLEHHWAFDARWVAPERELPFGSGFDPRLNSMWLPDAWSPATPLEEVIWSLPDETLARLAAAEGPPKHGRGPSGMPASFLAVLARFKPGTLEAWIERQLAAATKAHAWVAILQASDRFDSPALELARSLPPRDRLHLLIVLSSVRGEPYVQMARVACSEAGKDSHGMALSFLADHFPVDLTVRMKAALASKELDSNIPSFIYSKAFAAVALLWDNGGRDVFEDLLASGYDITGNFGSHGGMESLYSHAIRGMVIADPPLPAAVVKDGVARALQAIQASGKDKKMINALMERIWFEVVQVDPRPLRDPLFRLLGDSLKTLRLLAVDGLKKLADDELIRETGTLLSNGKLDQKLGAAALLAEIRCPAVIDILQAALAGEQNDKVRAAIHDALKGSQPEKAAPDGPRVIESPDTRVPLTDLEASYAKQAARLKFPPTSWLKPAFLPPVVANDGTPLSPEAIVFLISKQSKHKALDAAPDILPLLAHIDRGKSAPFALALVEGFLNSEQAAADRWALALGGLLGDNRIIPPLLSRIPDWCENSRHKLAEYAAQAISLLPGNEPLMVLDTLANRYRSKFKNVGKACAAAFNAAAAARGITPDELGDLVVPDFGFDADGVRRFDWDGGGASAELGADFKLSWSDPDTDKSWKALPASAPAAVKDEVKTLGKLLREAVKGQTARLEMALVRQRRWPVARWRELYENHPLLRSFASGLVWGIYDASGSLLRTFRRYPNGLLANATGDLEELPESDASIGMVHPLELDPTALTAWGSHLARFKVKQPFPQIGRPVELLDPLHGNRREIALTKGKQVGAGTFKSRSEKRGWYRGSVVDAGGISSVYKPFPGAGYEAILATDNYWVGIDPMDSVELGAAYFVKADSVERGSYTYDDPAPDDPRVLRFDQVPAVVWSETMADLKAIIGA